MKNKKISVKTIIIILLVGINIALIMMNLNNKNNNIEQQLIQKEQLEETTEDNAYILMQKHISEVQEKEQKLVSFKSVIASAITEEGILTEENADADTMANNIRNLSVNKTIDYKEIFSVESLIKTDWNDTTTRSGTCGILTNDLNIAFFKATIDCTIKAYFSMSYSGDFQDSYIKVSDGCEIIEKKVDTNNKKEYIIKVPKGKTVTIHAGAYAYTSYSMGVMCSKLY